MFFNEIFHRSVPASAGKEYSEEHHKAQNDEAIHDSADGGQHFAAIAEGEPDYTDDYSDYIHRRQPQYSKRSVHHNLGGIAHQIIMIVPCC